MAQKNTLLFKVFLTNEGVNEVRRFSVGNNVLFSLERFKEELQGVFPILRTHYFNVAWTDSDGDLISISSTEELTTALKEQKTEVHKLHVTIRDGPIVQGQYQKHVGVTCDGCHGEVVGFRYKCIQCFNFDLCATCESRGLHPEHCMIRFPVSTSYKREGTNHLVFMPSGKPKFYITKE